jgi:hypothetical protein
MKRARWVAATDPNRNARPALVASWLAATEQLAGRGEGAGLGLALAGVMSCGVGSFLWPGGAKVVLIKEKESSLRVVPVSCDRVRSPASGPLAAMSGR